MLPLFPSTLAQSWYQNHPMSGEPTTLTNPVGVMLGCCTAQRAVQWSLLTNVRWVAAAPTHAAAAAAAPTQHYPRSSTNPHAAAAAAFCGSLRWGAYATFSLWHVMKCNESNPHAASSSTPGPQQHPDDSNSHTTSAAPTARSSNNTYKPAAWPEAGHRPL